MLVGIYKLHGSSRCSRKDRLAMPGSQRLMEHADKKGGAGRDVVVHFDLRETPIMSELKGRLVISWPVPIQWCKWSSKVDYDVVETLPKSVFRKLPAVRPLKDTERAVTSKQRIGQVRFREALTSVWGGRCSVTSCSLIEALVASHVKPWAKSTPCERPDHNNGLLLAAHLDRLFDRFLITFKDNGQAIISDAISAEDRSTLGLTGNLRLRKRLTPEAKLYMAWHRERFNTK